MITTLDSPSNLRKSQYFLYIVHPLKDKIDTNLVTRDISSSKHFVRVKPNFVSSILYLENTLSGTIATNQEFFDFDLRNSTASDSFLIHWVASLSAVFVKNFTTIPGTHENSLT